MNVTLINLTLTNGHTNDNGGAILNYVTLTITNSKLQNNDAGKGGAIYNGNGVTVTNTITNCTLQNNTANNSGGAIYNTDGTVTVTNTTLTNNSGITGGAIYNSKTSNINNSKLNYNAADIGGAL